MPKTRAEIPVESIDNVSKKNITELEKSLLEPASKINNPILKAKKIYDELNKRVTYSMKWTKKALDNRYYDPDMISMYRSKVSFENTVEGASIICKGWSELYAEALVDAGFDPSKVKIEATGIRIGCHKWVRVDLGDNKTLLADAADSLFGSTDLANAKMGLSSNGFIVIDTDFLEANGGLSIRPRELLYSEAVDIHDVRAWNDNASKEIANILGENIDNPIDKATSIFGDIFAKITKKVSKKEYDKLAQKVLENATVPKNASGMETLLYLKKIVKNFYGVDHIDSSEWDFSCYVNDLGDSITVVKMNFIDEEKWVLFGNNGSKTIVNSPAACHDLLKGYDII